MGLLYISLGGHLDIPIIKQGHFGDVMFALNPKNGIALPRMDACKQVKYFFEEKGSIVFFLEAKVIFFQKISRRFSQSRVCEVYWKFLLLSFHNQMQLGFRAWLKGFRQGKKGKEMEEKVFVLGLQSQSSKQQVLRCINACFYDWWKIKSQFLIITKSKVNVKKKKQKILYEMYRGMLQVKEKTSITFSALPCTNFSF